MSKKKFDMTKLFDPFDTPPPAPKLFSIRTGKDDCKEFAYMDGNGVMHKSEEAKLLSTVCPHGQLINLEGCKPCAKAEDLLKMGTLSLREEIASLQAELERVRDERDKLQDECDALSNEIYTYRGY